MAHVGPVNRCLTRRRRHRRGRSIVGPKAEFCRNYRRQYFANLGLLAEGDPVIVDGDRFGVTDESSERQWELFYDRFDLTKEPIEPYRFGWAVESDPNDPMSTPKKRAARGRTKHEGHTAFVAPGVQVALHSGDDERCEYAYTFVTSGSYNPDDRAANMDLLDEAPSTSPGSTTTAGASGCPWSSARAN